MEIVLSFWNVLVMMAPWLLDGVDFDRRLAGGEGADIGWIWVG